MGILDRFTSIDDLLVDILERLGGVTEEDTHFFTYPNDGTRGTITKGTTTIDFMGGTVKGGNELVTSLGNSLRARGREYCRSLSLQADKDITIQIGTKSKIPIFAGTWFKVAHLRFQEVKIVAAENTQIFVIGCTNPDAIEMVGEAYIKDPTDSWGQLTTIGMSELSVRIQAPPITFDRRGDVIRWCDFESSTPNYTVTADPGTVHGRSTDAAAHGDFCYKSTVHLAETVEVETQTSDFHVGRMGASHMFSIDHVNPTVSLIFCHYTGAKLTRGVISYDTGAQAVKYLNDGGGMEYIRAVSPLEGIHAFSTMKLVVDLDKREYVRMLIHGQEIDMSDIPMYYAGSATTKRLSVASRIYNDALTRNVYVDNIIITENEPI